jgi:ribosome-associated protein
MSLAEACRSINNGRYQKGEVDLEEKLVNVPENQKLAGQQDRELVLSLCEILYNKKAQDILAIHVADKTIIADWFIICSGRAVPQVKALCDEVEDKAPALGLSLRRKEGYPEGRWIVLDYASILVHVFIPEERKYYNMERLWMDDPNGAIQYSQQMEEKEQQSAAGQKKE